MRLSYENSDITSLIDLRPSLINTLPINIAVEHILNPRISSTELMKKFLNMDRILENVTTYFFENFLNLAERTIISTEF